ncbi:MAG: hypothetical protein J7540_06315, partial [Roseofilum sp. SID2]|uniref:RHS repeat-associated core domain-containing protein n=1 Tax=Roseofilum sp. SID2 TaxID=2821498 RepID=UPI001B2EE39A
YLRARYYDPTLGRFISRDAYQGSLNDPMSQHKYQYAHANPVVNTDPSGYATFTQIAAASAFLTTLAGLSYTTGAAGAVLADGGSLGDAVALYDQFFAGYSDALTFGFSTLARRLRYNDTATQNHRGLFFNLGRFGGTLSSTWIGSRAAGFGDLGSASWWARGALGYDLFGAGVGMVQSARSVAETGRITLLDVLAFLPAISWRLSGTEGLGTGIKQTRAFPRRNQPFGPSAKGLEILNDYQLDLHHKLVTSSDLGGIPLQPGEIGFKDIAALTNATGWEHGVIRLQDGTRLIVQGTNEGLTHLPTLDVKRIIVHSHPGELPYHLEPSGLKGDVGYLWTINQRRSYIVTSEAHMEGYDYWLGVFENDGFWRGINTPMEMVVQGVIKDLR